MSDDDLEQEPQRQLSPIGLYSHASEVADRFPQMKGTPQQFKAMLMKQGVKPDELKWSGYDQKFAGRPLITKQELAQHFRESMPKVQETVLNAEHPANYAGRRDRPIGASPPPKFQQYTLPGGQNYREVLMHLPPEKVRKMPPGYEIKHVSQFTPEERRMHGNGPYTVFGPAWGGRGGMGSFGNGRTPEEAIAAAGLLLQEENGDVYKSSHWVQPNVLAHLRMSDRKGPKGEKLLHLEELQSDWAQEGRKKGFGGLKPEEIKELTQLREAPAEHFLRRPEANQRYAALLAKQNGIPEAPYVDSTQKWVDLGLKRLLHEAARGGYHKIVVTPGEEQAKRYDLSKQVKRIEYSPEQKHLHALPLRGGDEGISTSGVTLENLESHVGKDVARKLLESKPITTPAGFKVYRLEGSDLRVGGEGMKAFYDKMLPQALEKLAKKHDPEAKVVLHGHDFKKGPVANPWHVVDPHDGESIERFATEQSARNWATDQAQRNYGVPMERMYRIEHRGRKGEARVNHGHALEITPKMRASILKGQPAYASGGAVPDVADMMGHNQGPPMDTSVVPQTLNIARAKVQPTASHAELGRLLEKTRGTKIGAMIDQYQKPAVGTAVKRIHGDLKSLAQEGEPGRMWYEKSSKRLLDYVGGNKDEAHKLAQLIAIYSPQTSVDVNTANAIKAYNRAKSGQKMWAGDIVDRDKSFDTIKAAHDYAKSLGKNVEKVPLDDSGKRFLFARHNIKGYENIATAGRDLKAHLLMNHGIPFEGRKTNNFYRNLMTHIDPTMDQGSTQDLWMARAFGFHDDAVSNASKYDFMEKLTHKLGVELGWKPHQVQAAIWTAMKTRQEAVKNDVMKKAVEHGIAKMVPSEKGKTEFKINPGQEHIYSSLMRKHALEAVLDPGHIARSARDFSDFLDQNLAHVSWEATPSKQIAHLNGLEQKPPEVKADYHKRISEALQDEHGNDLLAKYLNVLSPGTVEAPGYWQGNVNPASHTQIAATRIKAAGQRPDIDEASKELMNHYADARGLLLKQDAVGYHRPFYNPKVSAANGVEFKFDKDLTGDQIRKLGQTMDEHVPDTAVIPSGPRTVRVINFSGMPDHRPYHKAVGEALHKANLGDITAHQRLFASDGDLRGNDWSKSPHGEDYRSRLGAAGRSDVLRYISDVLAPKVQAVDEAFAKEHGLKRDHKLEAALRKPPAEEVSAPVKLPKAAGGSVNHDPSEAQKAAGNYAKERFSFQGLPVSIENKRGSVRSGVDDKGKRWQARLPADYGYVRGTEGADGDHVDCFVGPEHDSNLVVVVDQHHHRNGRFDEHKCMLGYHNERDALRDYAAAFSDGHGHDRIGHVQSMSVDAFKKWLKYGRTKRPAASQSIVDQALQLAAKRAA